MPLIYPILVSVAVAIVATFWIYPWVLHVALLKNVVDKPAARKLQSQPVPVLGGIAVFFGLTVGLFVAQLMVDCAALFPVFCGLLFLLFIGLLDDILDLSAWLRLGVEIAVVLLLVYTTGCSFDCLHGLWGVGGLPFGLAIALTLIASVGIINAINMIDGVDGLSSGFGFMACVLFGVMFSLIGDLPMAILTFVSAGVLLPFFLHNVFGWHSKMFIGDSGTLSLGLLMAICVVKLLCSGSPYRELGEHWGVISFTVAVLSIPVFDTLRVMITRMLHKKSPFNPDKTHLHHLFIQLGFSHIGTTVAILTFDFLSVVLWWVVRKAGASLDGQLYAVVIWSVLITFGLYKFLYVQKKHNTRFYHVVQRLAKASHVERGSFFLWIQHKLDRSTIVVMFKKEKEEEHKEQM